MPISVTNFPFRVASRRFNYILTDERTVVCNTDHEVVEEQQWAISDEAEKAVRSTGRKKATPHPPKPKPKSKPKSNGANSRIRY